MKDKNVFKKGDCVVLLKKQVWRASSIPTNYCYKLSRDSSSIEFIIEKDINDYKNNGWISTNPLKLKLRAATPRETEKYHLLNKPFDVTTLEPEIIEKENYDYLIPILIKLNIHE
jgi:hypothetical protein